MAVDVNITSIGSGFNRTVIDNNFIAIQNALQNALSRDGTLPNSMEADIDMDSNDLLNVGDINTERLFVNGEEFVAGDVSAVGDRGWSPSFAIVQDSARRVLQLTGYVGGEGTAPTDNIGKYVGATQMETLIANGVDIRGPQGATGAGTGDMLAAQNLNDVASKPTAFANIKQAATTSATGVVELATTTEAATGTDTTRAVTPAGLTAFAAANPGGSEVLLDEGTFSGSANLDFILSTYTDYKHIKIILTGVRATSGSPNMFMRYSTNGGSSFDSGIVDYYYAQVSAYPTNNSSVSATAGNAMLIENGISSLTGGGLDLNITLYDWQNSGKRLNWMGEFVKSSSSGGIVLGRIGGFRNAAQANNAVRFLLSSSTFSNVDYSIYGVR
jgi:hypothetical protein